LTGGEHRAILGLFHQEEQAVHPTVAAQLKAFNLATISARLQTVTAAWARLEIDQLPVRDKTLALLQAEYAELLGALPVSAPDELEALLQQAARAMRLKGDRLSVSQERFLVSHLDGGPHPQGMKLHSADSPGAAAYIRSICDHPGTLVRSFTGGSLFYLVSHWRLGVDFPTFTEELRQQLCTPAVQQMLVDPTGGVRLSALVRIHASWLAALIEQQKADRADRDDDEMDDRWADDYDGAIEP
jgi:hypothetical protein